MEVKRGKRILGGLELRNDVVLLTRPGIFATGERKWLMLLETLAEKLERSSRVPLFTLPMTGARLYLSHLWYLEVQNPGFLVLSINIQLVKL